MKPFDVFANIIAGLFVWMIVTAIACFFVIWGSDEAPGKGIVWPLLIGILILSGWSFSLYAKRYWNKLDL